MGWEAERETVAAVNAPVTTALVAALAVRPTDTVLDLAGGTGDMAEALAGRVAHVLSTDFSPAMVEAARRRGIEGVEHRVIDMQAIDLPDASVDAVVCRFGYMLVPDPALALRETHRVLRPGGRLAFATWAPAERNPWATAYGPVLLERGLQEPPAPGEPGPFALAEPAQIEALVKAAGFAEVAVEQVPVEYRFADWAAYRRIVTGLAATLRQTLDALPGNVRAEVDEAARKRLERFNTAAGYVLPGLALVAVARGGGEVDPGWRVARLEEIPAALPGDADAAPIEERDSAAAARWQAVAGSLRQRRWHAVRRHLGIRSFGVNAAESPAGGLLVIPHDESQYGQEELYLVVRGRARFVCDGVDVDVGPGEVLFVRPDVHREATAVEPTLLVLVGGLPDESYRPPAWSVDAPR